MINFRKAEIKDSELISTLVNSAYRGDSSKIGWTTEADLLGGQRTDAEKIREMIEDIDSHIELTEIDDKVLGCVYLKKEQTVLYFGMLTVNPTLQNQGIGKVLLNRIEELSTLWGIKTIRMTVISVRKELIDYYERRGYERTGKTEPFPANDPRFGLPKTKLEFHEFAKNLSE